MTSVGVSLPPPIAKEKPPINVVGDVSGRIAIMVDDLIDDVQSFVDAAAVLKERGAYKIYVMATHGILSKEAPRLIEDSAIDEVSVFGAKIRNFSNLIFSGGGYKYCSS